MPFSRFWKPVTDTRWLSMIVHDRQTYVCPDKDMLKNMKTVRVWAEDVAGKVHLEIASIQATCCSSHLVLRR